MNSTKKQHTLLLKHLLNILDGHNQGRQESCWAPGQKETWPPSSNSPNNNTQTKSTTVCPNGHSDIHESTYFILFALFKVHPRFFSLVWLVCPLNPWAPGRRTC